MLVSHVLLMHARALQILNSDAYRLKQLWSHRLVVWLPSRLATSVRLLDMGRWERWDGGWEKKAGEDDKSHGPDAGWDAKWHSPDAGWEERGASSSTSPWDGGGKGQGSKGKACYPAGGYAPAPPPHPPYPAKGGLYPPPPPSYHNAPGYNAGYDAGYAAGWQAGHDDAWTEAYSYGFAKGLGKGLEKGWEHAEKPAEKGAAGGYPPAEASTGGGGEGGGGGGGGTKRKKKRASGLYHEWEENYQKRDPVDKTKFPRFQVWNDHYWSDFLEKINEAFREKCVEEGGKEIANDGTEVVDLGGGDQYIYDVHIKKYHKLDETVQKAIDRFKNQDAWDESWEKAVVGYQIQQGKEDQPKAKYRPVRMVTEEGEAEAKEGAAGGAKAKDEPSDDEAVRKGGVYQ